MIVAVAPGTEIPWDDVVELGSGRLMCGVFGVRAPGRDVARLTYFGLYALQHRGQESAGIAVSEDGRLTALRDLGLVPQVFDERSLSGLHGELAIGHTRYSTTGGNAWENAQPLLHHGRVAHRRARPQRQPRQRRGAARASSASRSRRSSDSEVIAALIADDERPLDGGDRRDDGAARRRGDRRRARRREALRLPRPLRLPAARARAARRRPGRRVGDVRARSRRREVRARGRGRASSWSPTRTGSHSIQALEPAEHGALCIFEFFYLARPDTRLSGVEVHGARVRMGERLAQESPVEADLVLPIPDSGTPAAIGFARATGIPFSEGLIKNRYVGRTFIQPEQGMREQGIRMKFNPLAEVAGKRLVVVDDSIVRGSTTRQIVQMLFDAGAAEVHVRISSPPVVSPCFYGIDLASEDEMIAAHSTVEEVREAIGATSLAYISLEGLQAATHRPANALCRACLTREYPTRVPLDAAKHRFERV